MTIFCSAHLINMRSVWLKLKQYYYLLKELLKKISRFKERDEFHYQIKILKYCCIRNSDKTFWKIFSKFVLVLNISVNLFCFYGLTKYAYDNPKHVVGISEFVTPFLGVIMTIANCVLMLTRSESILEILSYIQGLNRECR